MGYSHRRDVLLGNLPRHEVLPPKLKREWSLVVDKFGVSLGGDLKLVHRTNNVIVDVASSLRNQADKAPDTGFCPLWVDVPVWSGPKSPPALWRCTPFQIPMILRWMNIISLSLSSSNLPSSQRRGGGRHLTSTPERGGGIRSARPASPPHPPAQPIIGYRLIISRLFERPPPLGYLYLTLLLLLLLRSVSNWLPCDQWGGRQSIKLPRDPPTYLWSTHLVTSSIGRTQDTLKAAQLLGFRIVIRYYHRRDFIIRSLRVQWSLRSITPVVTQVHVILRNFLVLTWMRDTIELD